MRERPAVGFGNTNIGNAHPSASPWRLMGLLVLVCADAGCSTSHPAAPPRWLATCTVDTDCAGSGTCLCGRCTVACQDSCASGPANTVCTRTSSCGRPASGVCLARCVQASDCASGLSCQEGVCTATLATDGSAVEPDQPSLAGTLTQGSTQATWARTFPGMTMASPEVVRGPQGEILVHVTSERLPHVYTPLVIDDWLMRLDGDTGKMLWIEKVNPGLSMAMDAAGSIVLAWPTLLQKLDASGALLWAIPRPAQAVYEEVKVTVDNANDIVLARTELDSGPGQLGADPRGLLLLEKLDANGAPLWSHSFGDGTSSVYGAFAAVDGANDVVFWSPLVQSPVDFGGGPLTGKNVLARYDALGQHLWSKVLGGFASNSFPNQTPVVVDSSSNILVANEVSEPVDIGLGQIWCTPEMVLKFDAAGTPQWNKCMPVNHLSVLPDAGFVTLARVFETTTAAGTPCVPLDEDDGLLALYDKDGNGLQSYCLAEPGYQAYGAIIPDSTGTFILVGASSTGLTLPGGMVLAPVDANVWTAFVAKITPWNG
jgi:hypothetical protein